MTTSQVAQMVMAIFPPTSKYTPNETAVFGEDGNSVIYVKEMESGCSKVFGFPCKLKSYGQLKAAEKKAMVDYISSIKVDIVTNVHYDGFETKQYYLAGTYENFKEKRSYAKEYKIEPYNY